MEKCRDADALAVPAEDVDRGRVEGLDEDAGPGGPMSLMMRFFISSVALLVKVTAKMAYGGHALFADQVGDPVGDDPGLAGAGARQDEERPLGVERPPPSGWD